MAAAGERFIAACVQMRATADKTRNVDTALRLIEEAVARGASLVALPELFSWRGPNHLDQGIAEAIEGDTIAHIQKIAADLRLTIVAGSIFERSPEPGGRPFNTSVVVGSNGAVLARYRKMHLFDVSIQGRVDVRESERFTAGDGPVCVQTDAGRIGLSVCYDLRFPELYRQLVRSGAEILCIPSAFTHTTGSVHWDVLVRARAIENQCYVLAPNQIGPTEHGPAVWGHSAIVDPWGTVLAEAPDTECVITAEIDFALLARVRREVPCLEHVRIGI